MKKMLLTAFAVAVLCATPMLAKAANETDIAKISCKDLLSDKQNLPMMLMWIDGYMSGKSDNTVISNEWMEKLGTHLGKFCGANPAKTVLDAIEAMPAE